MKYDVAISFFKNKTKSHDLLFHISLAVKFSLENLFKICIFILELNLYLYNRSPKWIQIYQDTFL